MDNSHIILQNKLSHLKELAALPDWMSYLTLQNMFLYQAKWAALLLNWQNDLPYPTERASFLPNLTELTS